MDSSTREFFLIPENCSVCSGSLSLEGDFLYCRNNSCPSKISNTIKVWINKLGVLHWGDAFIEALTSGDSPRVYSIADLYELSPEDMIDYCSGLKFAKKCHSSLHSMRDISIERVFGSLNVPLLAESTAQDIVRFGFDTPSKIFDANVEDLLKVPNIGRITAERIYEGLRKIRPDVERLLKYVNLKVNLSGPLSGKSFCITGATSVPRKSLQNFISDNGGIVRTSVSKDLDYLISEEPSTSTKSQKAVSYGVKIITVLQLRDMVNRLWKILFLKAK